MTERSYLDWNATTPLRLEARAAMMAAMEGFKRLFAADNLAVRLLRNMGLSQVDKLKPVKNEIIKRVMGL